MLSITGFPLVLNFIDLKKWSQRPDSNRRPAHYDSNPRPLAWEANALPTELCPRFNAGYNITSFELAPLFFSNSAANFRVFFR